MSQIDQPRITASQSARMSCVNELLVTLNKEDHIEDELENLDSATANALETPHS